MPGFTDDNPIPLYISEGERLREVTESGTQYGFLFKSFAGVPVCNFPKDYNPEKRMTQKQQEDFFPKELSEMIVFHPIKWLLKKNTSSPYPDWNGGSLQLKESFREERSGGVTSRGTIIPQIVSPLNLCNNLIVTDERTDGQENLIWQRVLSKEEKGKISGNTKDYAHSVTVNSAVSNAHFIRMHGARPWDRLSLFQHVFEAWLPDCSAFAILCDIFHENEFARKDKPPLAKFEFYECERDGKPAPKGKRDFKIDVSPQSGTSVSIGNDSNSIGTLLFGDNGPKPIFSIYRGLKNRNSVVFTYPLLNKMIVEGQLLASEKEDGHSISCLVNPDMNLQKKLDPPIMKFPNDHKTGSTNHISVSSDCYMSPGNRVRAIFQNCSANFGIAELRFVPKLRFSYYYRMVGKNNLSNTAAEVTEGMQTKDYYCLMVGGNLSGYSGYSQKFNSEMVYRDADRDECVYRIDVEIENENGRFQKEPLEILGMVHVVKRIGKLADIRNGNGNFSSGFRQYNLPDGDLSVYTSGGGTSSASDWMTYITSVSVKHDLNGSSGTVSLDKYMMYESLGRVTLPVIGALTLVANNGYYDRNPGENRFSPLRSDIFGTMPSGQIFKGFVTEVQDSTSEGSAQINLTLAGIQKKLEDMKHINCPFWDGDYIFDNTPYSPLNYLRAYTGCDLVFSSELSNGTVSRGNPTHGRRHEYFLPRSISYANPCVHYTIGTSILESLNQIAPLVNHRFVIQPDGRGYFYGLNEFGMPTWVQNGPVRRTFLERELESLSLTPFLENHYNSFVTLGIKGVVGRGNSEQIVPDPNRQFPLMKYYENKSSALQYPWSRILVRKVDGIVEEKEFLQQHAINVNYGGKIVYQGSITIPGYEQIFMFDRINIKKNDNAAPMEFYVTGVSHSVNLSSKEWKTTIDIAGIHATGSAVQIGDL